MRKKQGMFKEGYTRMEFDPENYPRAIQCLYGVHDLTLKRELRAKKAELAKKAGSKK